MSFPKKNNTFKPYVKGALSNLFFSQFLYLNPNPILRIKRLWVDIQTKKHKKVHYFYLWLLTKRCPRAAKFNLSWKNISQNSLIISKAKRQRLETDLRNKKHLFRFLHTVLWQIVTKQTNSEKKILAFQRLNVQLKMFAVPLTQSTLKLQAANSYFPNIPLTLHFRFSYSTAFEKLFFLRALKFLSLHPKLKSLDFF